MTNETRDQDMRDLQRGSPDGHQPRVWRDLDEFAASDSFEQIMHEQFPREAAAFKASGLERRTFLKIMGASLVLGGLQLAGCTTPAPPDDDSLIVWARAPEQVVPGEPLFFTTAMTLAGYGHGVLLETHQGRPHRVDGNPAHPATRGGGSSPMLLASLLDLYNPERSLFVRNNNELTDWDSFVAAVGSVLEDAGAGAGLRILTEMVTSPTLAAQLGSLLEQYPEARWYQYEPAALDAQVAGSQLAFGEAVETVYNFREADVVVSLDADFMSNMSASVRYAHDFAERRRVRIEDGTDVDEVEMNRLYMVQSLPTVTGALADNKLALRPSQIEVFARALASELGAVSVGDLGDAAFDTAWLDAVVADLEDNAGRCIVIAGTQQPAAVHALVHAINVHLGNVGTTVEYRPSALANPVVAMEQITELVEEMNAGAVDALFMIGGNPVWNAPADLNFADALATVDFSVHLSLYNNETAQVSTWHVPQTHYIEAWSDVRAFDTSPSVVQPPIGPLYDTVRSSHQLLALLNGDDRAPYDIVRETWQERFSDVDDFERFWRATLHDGVAPDAALASFEPTVSGELADNLPAPVSGGETEVVFHLDPNIYDGRFANNAWLQELPHPFTKIVWDTAALVSPATARELRVSTGQIVNLTVGDFTTQMPVWVQPNHAEGAVSVFLGYGTGISADVRAGYSFNAYAIRTTDAPWIVGGATVERSGGRYNLVTTRRAEATEPAEDFARVGTLAQFRSDPNFAFEPGKPYTMIEDGPISYDGYAWGMTIDIATCIGCNACIMACQTENNIPTVGKDAVANSREMYWIRVDHYVEDGGVDAFQPVACVHCETAPCELVCPVQATLHSHEGLNMMVYNRCVGTRYCSANCPYGVRRFNFSNYVDESLLAYEYRNPDVSVRYEGVMEKCTYCTQRINKARADAKRLDVPIPDGAIVPACAAACPTNAIVFGDINDASARVSLNKAQPLNYDLLDGLNTRPRTSYLAKLVNPNTDLSSADEN